MSIRLESITLRNPSPIFNRAAPSMALCHAPPASLGFKSFARAKIHCKVSVPALPRVLGLSPRQKNVRKRVVLSFAASHEESSKASDIDVEKEKEDLKAGSQESEEAWQQTLASFKEQALKLQSVSKEAYELYSEKATVILKETSEKLKIQAEKASQDLSVIAKEIAAESTEYLSNAAKNSPEPMRDVVETFTSSPNQFSDVSKLQDYHVGIPYGALLSIGGFLSFMITGSIPAIRFGIILGGALLALSISSLKLSKKGEAAPLLLKGQTAIATLLFLRQLRLLFMRPLIANFLTTFISGVVVAFYLKNIIKDRRQEESGGSAPEVEPQN